MAMSAEYWLKFEALHTDRVCIYFLFLGEDEESYWNKLKADKMKKYENKQKKGKRGQQKVLIFVTCSISIVKSEDGSGDLKSWQWNAWHTDRRLGLKFWPQQH